MSNRSNSDRETIRSRQNPQVQEARRIAHDVRLAKRERLFVADGSVLVQEALDAGLKPHSLFIGVDHPDRPAIEQKAKQLGHHPTLATQSVIEAISNFKTPQGAIGLFVRPDQEPATILGAVDASAPPLVAVLHGLQDPANAGSLVRSALAAGLSGILATEGTVDLFHPRAVRAAMGATFRLPLATDLSAETLWGTLQRGRYRTLALDPRGETPLEKLGDDAATAIILGSEGGGLDAAARAHCQIRVRIPMAPGVESLGVAVAGAIAFYALASSRLS